jgi:hypothetical protein
MGEPTIACSLDAKAYRDRLAVIRRLGEMALLDLEARPEGAALSFRNSEQVRAELSSIIEAEAACCSFLDLSLYGAGDRLILVISSPPDAVPVVRELVASFRGTQATQRTTA